MIWKKYEQSSAIFYNFKFFSFTTSGTAVDSLEVHLCTEGSQGSLANKFLNIKP